MAAALILGGCVAQPASGPVVAEALRVTNAGQPFADDQGAQARKLADATCAARGQRLAPSIYDRYEAGAWVYVEGCA